MYNSLIRRGGNNILRGRTGNALFISDLDTWHKGIDDAVFNEIQVPGLDAAILPRVVEYNGTTAYSIVADNGALDVNQATTDFCFGGFITTGSDIISPQFCGGKLIAGVVNGVYGFELASGDIKLTVRSSSEWVSINAGAVTINTTYHLLTRIDLAGNKIYFYINNILKNVGGTSYTGTFANLASVYEFYLGAGNVNGGNGATNYAECSWGDVRIYHKDVSGDITRLMAGEILGGEIFMAPNNDHTGFSYDITANVRHLTHFNTTYNYNANGSLYPAQNGYSLWQKELSIDIQVPLDLTGGSISLTPGVDIPTGYTKTRDIVGDLFNWNMADALVDFDPTVSTNALLDTFDRSNATIHSLEATASIYYNASFPYLWHITEISDPHIYAEFFNVGYKGRIFARINLSIDGTFAIVLYREELNYGTDKTGADEYKVMKYCNIEEFAILGANNEPILDDNDYVIIT